MQGIYEKKYRVFVYKQGLQEFDLGGRMYMRDWM